MCAIIGLIDVRSVFSGKDRSCLMRNLAIAAECRGTDATGFAYNNKGYLHVVKRPVPAHKMKLRLPNTAKVIVGHTRMTTQGDALLNYNNHPFMGKVNDLYFALAHNGILYNDDLLRVEHDLSKTKIETDSYVAVQLIEKWSSTNRLSGSEKPNGLGFDSLKYMAEQVQGMFTFAILDSDDNTWLVKGDNPICIYRSTDYGFFVYASTEEILKAALTAAGIDKLNYEQIQLVDGKILKISVDGQMERGEFKMSFRAFHEIYGDFSCYHNSYNWNRLCSYQPIEDTGYLSELKSIAACCGYSAEEIDELFAEGFTCEEIEEMLFV